MDANLSAAVSETFVKLHEEGNSSFYSQVTVVLTGGRNYIQSKQTGQLVHSAVNCPE